MLGSQLIDTFLQIIISIKKSLCQWIRQKAVPVPVTVFQFRSGPHGHDK